MADPQGSRQARAQDPLGRGKRVTATAGGVSAEPGQGPSADSSGTTAAWARATAQSACGCAAAHSRTGGATSFTTPP